MIYSIQALKNGECKLKGRYAFSKYDPEGIYTFYLYLWIIKGDKSLIAVDTGLKNVEEMNRQASHILHEPIRQAPGEETADALSSAGIDPKDVEMVIITHFHYDHCSDLQLYPKARIVVSKKGYEMAKNPPGGEASWAPTGFLNFLDKEKKRVEFVGDQDLLPGISAFWIGGHSPCSQAVSVMTAKGKAILTGDTVLLYKNVELEEPIGIYSNLDECRAAMKRIKSEADIILPSHDPLVLTLFPNGIVG